MEQNHGIILGQRDTDWMAGAFTFISFEERLPSGDWTPYLVTKEKQYGKQDSMSCVSFSGCTAIEIQEKFLTGKESNYSDRWIAKRSGTTVNGNWLYKVGNTIRKEGLVAESSYPAPANYTFDEYHAEIPAPLLTALQAEGKAWLEKWTVQTEFIPTDKASLLKHIKHAPIQIATQTHAIVYVVKADENGVTVFDTYPHSGDYLTTIPYSQIAAAYKYVLTPKDMPEPRKFLKINDGGKIYIAVLQGFGGTLVAAKSEEALAELSSALEVPVDSPVYNYPQTN